MQDVSATDIQAPVAAYQASIRHGPAPIGEIEVITHDEVRIHDEPAPSNYVDGPDKRKVAGWQRRLIASGLLEMSLTNR